MKRLIFMALLLTGCSHTTVHLYSRYLSDEQINNISQTLIEQNFVVKTNQLSFPDSVTDSTLIFSPFMQDGHAVNILLETLSAQDWQIAHTSMLFADNHWYKENSIALMLLPKGINPQYQNQAQDWAKTYTSQTCETELTLKLDTDGRYQIFTADQSPLIHERAKGQWDLSQFSYMTFNVAELDWPFYFEAKTSKQHDLIGEIHIFELIPMDNYYFLDNCSFVFGQRI